MSERQRAKRQRLGSESESIETRHPGYGIWDAVTASSSQFQVSNDSYDTSARPPDYSRSIPSSKYGEPDPYVDHVPASDVNFRPKPDFDASQRTLVCFGEVNGLLGKYKDPTTQGSYRDSFRIQLKSSDQFSAMDDDSVTGIIDADYTHLTYALLDEPEVKLQLTCSRDVSQALKHAKSRVSKLLVQAIPCSVSIVIYGPRDMFDEIGTFFQTNEMYLQDPRECDRNVRYYNPHRLSAVALDSCPWTFELKSHFNQPMEMTIIDPQPDLLDLMNSHDLLPETPQPLAIQTSLERHQKQALTFMQRRELGWALDGSRPDIWEHIETNQGDFFINRVSDVHQEEPPEEFYGGIIADPMGLGKTLTMIALVASDIPLLRPGSMEYLTNQTLVVVPPALLDTWEEQLSEHVIRGNLTWCRHHGKTKLANDVGFGITNIVLTTYHTVSAEWKAHGNLTQSMLFSRQWKRVILDEAHVIRNGNSQIAQSVCALEATNRWAVTGTPIQNRLSDLATLLKFLRIDPYQDRRRFEADISNVWKEGNTDEAVKRLKRLAGCLLLRRKKTTISLPLRRDLQCPIEFTVAERGVYQEIRHHVIARIDDLMYEHSEHSKPSGYVNVLQQIEAMRMFCNLGLHYYHRHQPALNARDQDSDWQTSAQQAFNFQLEMGRVEWISSKVAALVTQIRSLASHVKSIVFSTWRTTLDVLEVGLNEASITTLRFDGKVPQKDRKNVIDRFRKDPSVRVLLLTLSCGAVGLTLTAASYAFLMEPHWNPTIEDQALARIHRLGQKREVTTVRFYVRDSFEQVRTGYLNESIEN
ncbi:hypothetical protein AK830_g9236 [Neonectria ditissima]|uniref:Helicase ATP-binding domain-containing protein n=1 Tax=Neonectria ditissima TaxID=78410 RepID=A0A0P7BCQ9_9HYPO|nr:hypothetical protein AK830_g9236 [Neonectria ditissima]